MSAYIFCGCSLYNQKCYLCREGKAAHKAGLRAYRQGKSRYAKPAHSGFGYRWTDGWYEGRNANPNTLKKRLAEKAAETQRRVAQLKRDRQTIDRKLRVLIAS